MSNTGPKKPENPVAVLVQRAGNPSLWDYGLLREWRWTNEGNGEWEGHVNVSEACIWVEGGRLRRAGIGRSPEPPIKP